MRIDPIIKTFIEENKYYIENGNMYMLFTSWYNYRLKSFPDATQFEELLSILEKAGISKREDTVTVRESAIMLFTKGVLDDIRNNPDIWLDSNHVSKRFLFDNLYSLLGLTKDQIMKLIDQCAKDEKLIEDEDGLGYIFPDK